MTDPEELLAQTLHRRVEDTTHDPTPLTDVVATARGIRRRQRRRAVLAVAAAVVVVTVPTAVILGADDAPAPNRPTGPPPWVTERQSPSAAEVRLQDLDRGPDPRIGYVDGRSYIGYGGARTLLPARHGISAVTPYHGGFLVADTRFFEGSVGLTQYDGSGGTVGEWCSTGSPVVSGDQLQTAYVTAVCRESGEAGSFVIHRGIASGMGEGETSQDVGRPVSLVGILGDRIVYTGQFGEGAWITDLVSEPVAIAGLASVGGVNEQTGLAAGQRADSPGTGVVLDPETGDVRWSEPATTLGAFAPDGGHVLGLVDQGDGPCCPAVYDVGSGDPVPAVADALATLGVPQLPLVWEDGSHLLGVLTLGERRAIVRVGLDGRVTRASDVLAAGSDHDIVFAAHP